MAQGSELSSLPARLSSCTGMLAQITLRNASSSIFPAGPHFLTQSDTAHAVRSAHAQTRTFSSKEMSARCAISICCCPSALVLFVRVY